MKSNGFSFLLNQVILLALLVLNSLSYFSLFFKGIWASPAIVLLVLTYAFALNYRYMLARHFSWANIFLTLLALFHLGYYIPARLGLIEEFSFLPSVSSAVSEMAVLLFVTATLAFEFGVLTGCRRASIIRCPLLMTSRITDDSSTLLFVGITILATSLLLLAVFVLQAGGIGNVLQMDYTKYWEFMDRVDPRFVETGITFFPVGILVVYVGLLFDQQRRAKYIKYVWIAATVFMGWLLFLGDRGAAFLLLLGLLYLGHLCQKPISIKTIFVVGVFSVLAIPFIAAYRSVAVGSRLEVVQNTRLLPLAAAVEMGQTYRTLVGFVDFFWQEDSPLMTGKSYWMAMPSVLPNLGFSKGSAPNADYYRSAMWITKKLDPTTAEVSSGGLGSTGIGEPYANFGYFGVVGFFGLVGLAVGGLEQHFLRNYSRISIAVICGIFIPTNWYIRDDWYGTFRPIVWSLAAIALLFFLSRSRQRFRRGIIRRRCSANDTCPHQVTSTVSQLCKPDL